MSEIRAESESWAMVPRATRSGSRQIARSACPTSFASSRATGASGSANAARIESRSKSGWCPRSPCVSSPQSLPGASVAIFSLALSIDLPLPAPDRAIAHARKRCVYHTRADPEEEESSSQVRNGGTRHRGASWRLASGDANLSHDELAPQPRLHARVGRRGARCEVQQRLYTLAALYGAGRDLEDSMARAGLDLAAPRGALAIRAARIRDAEAGVTGRVRHRRRRPLECPPGARPDEEGEAD